MRPPPLFFVACQVELLKLFGFCHIADLNPSTRTMRARALEIIGPHEIEVSEGVSIFIKGRKIKRLIAIEERMVRYPSNFDLLE